MLLIKKKHKLLFLVSVFSFVSFSSIYPGSLIFLENKKRKINNWKNEEKQTSIYFQIFENEFETDSFEKSFEILNVNENNFFSINKTLFKDDLKEFVKTKIYEKAKKLQFNENEIKGQVFYKFKNDNFINVLVSWSWSQETLKNKNFDYFSIYLKN